MGHYAPMPRGRWVIASFIPVGWLTWVGLGYARHSRQAAPVDLDRRRLRG